MTRDEIMAMQPGRELDMLICREVMLPDQKNEPIMQKPSWCSEFSTRISAAWEVVEKLMKDHRYRVDIIIDVNYSVQIMTHEGCEADFHAPTAPEAICKAALLAVMSD